MATVIFIINMALDMQYSMYIYIYSIYIHKIIHIYIYMHTFISICDVLGDAFYF